jgi:hypothetical protein
MAFGQLGRQLGMVVSSRLSTREDSAKLITSRGAGFAILLGSAMRRVFFLGGSACAGKTSVARLLAARHGLSLYSVDDRFEEHRRRADRERHPSFARLMDREPRELWVGPPEAQADDLIAFYRDELEMVLEDLADFPGPVLAEGVGLLPELVAPLLSEETTAAFLVSTAEFRRQAYCQRGPFVAELLAQCPDPEAAFARWMARDDLVAARIVDEARREGLPVLNVDGERSVEEVAAAVKPMLISNS